MDRLEAAKRCFTNCITAMNQKDSYDSAFIYLDDEVIGMGLGIDEFAEGKVQFYRIMKNSPFIFSDILTTVKFDKMAVKLFDNCASICAMASLTYQHNNRSRVQKIGYSAQLRETAEGGWLITCLHATPVASRVAEQGYAAVSLMSSEDGGDNDEKVYEIISKFMKQDLLASYSANLTTDLWEKSHLFSDMFILNYSADYERDIFRSAKHIVGGNDRLKFIQTFSVASLTKMYIQGNSEISMDLEIKLIDGNTKWIAINVFMQRNEHDQLIAQIYVVDIDERKRKELKLRWRSETDLMTGVYNKETTRKKINRVITDSMEDNVGVFIMLDVDDFKTINDTYGHETGDKAIVAVADVLKSAFRKNDIIGRLGGDEFGIFYTGNPDRRIISGKMAMIIKKVSEIEIDGKNIGITISAGIAERETENFDLLYINADKALYIRKRDFGKDGYNFYDRYAKNDDVTEGYSAVRAKQKLEREKNAGITPNDNANT